MSKISEFQAKDVVNVENGQRLGHIGDLEVNLTTGNIEAIVILSTGKFMGMFGKDNDLTIPWRNIVRIGKDVILVKHVDAGYSEEHD